MTSKKDLFTMMFFDAEDDLPPDTEQAILTYNAIDDVPALFLARQARSYIQTWNADKNDIPFDTLDAQKRITHWMYVYPPDVSIDVTAYKKKKYSNKCMLCKHYSSITFSHVSGKCKLNISDYIGSGGTCKKWEE